MLKKLTALLLALLMAFSVAFAQGWPVFDDIEYYNDTPYYENCFYDCDKLVNVTIPEGVKSIAYRAFYSCNGLKEITVPDSVTTINSDAFSGCSNTLTFCCSDDSAAAAYAVARGFQHKKL